MRPAARALRLRASSLSAASDPPGRDRFAALPEDRLHLSFSEWPKVFAGDEKLTTTLLDRLADGATVITPKGKSFRMRRRGQTQSVEADTRGPPALPSVAPAGRDDKTTKTKSK
jgi:hypothetical protein